jgi:hypothetical protein
LIKQTNEIKINKFKKICFNIFKYCFDKEIIEEKQLDIKKEEIYKIEQLFLKNIKLFKELQPIEFNKQKTYIIDIIRVFFDLPITNDEICAIINTCPNPEYNVKFDLQYYFTDTYNNNKNLLIAIKFYNKYAKYHNIRYEDSLQIITKYLHSFRRSYKINTSKGNYMPIFK